jgi:cold shock CspA family protein
VSSIPASGILRGRVLHFDEPRGLGTVGTDDGRRFDFHCTAIADGTRTIGIDAEVDFLVVAGHGGRMEAVTLTVR